MCVQVYIYFLGLFKVGKGLLGGERPSGEVGGGCALAVREL